MSYRSIFLPLALCVAACSQPAQPDAAKNATDRPARPRSQLTPEERARSPLTREWMVGYWVFGENCHSDGETALWPDGTYTMADGAGRWSLDGDLLTVNEERPPSVVYMQVRLGDGGEARIEKTGPSEILVFWPDAPPEGAPFRRCD